MMRMSTIGGLLAGRGHQPPTWIFVAHLFFMGMRLRLSSGMAVILTTCCGCGGTGMRSVMPAAGNGEGAGRGAGEEGRWEREWGRWDQGPQL